MNLKKHLIPNIPYVVIGLFATNLGEGWRLAAGSNASEKLLHIVDGLSAAFANPLPSFHLADICVGAAVGGFLRLAVYLKGKNAKKYRKNMEYGSARWGTSEDMYEAIPCKYCGKMFYPNRPNQVYCNEECRANGSFKMRYGHDPATKEGHPYNKRICIHCGQEFWPNGPNTKTCSTQCSHEHNKQKMRDWRAEKKVQVGSEMVRTAT